MTETELAAILSRMYLGAPDGEAVAMIQLFGVQYADEIVESGSSPSRIVKLSEIPDSYGTEVHKGMRLARYVVPRRSQEPVQRTGNVEIDADTASQIAFNSLLLALILYTSNNNPSVAETIIKSAKYMLHEDETNQSTETARRKLDAIADLMRTLQLFPPPP